MKRVNPMFGSGSGRSKRVDHPTGELTALGSKGPSGLGGARGLGQSGPGGMMPMTGGAIDPYASCSGSGIFLRN